MPDFPRAATAGEVWAYATRELTGLTGTPRTDLIGANESLDTHGYTTARAGKIDNLDAAITTRSSHDAADVWAVVARTLTAFTGTPRSDLVGTDNAVWAYATRTLTAITGTPRSDLLGEDATFEAGTGARKVRIDDIPAFEAVVEGSLLMDTTEQTLVEKTDDKSGLLEGIIDLTPMQAGDTVVVREYMQVLATGAYAKYAEETYSGIQSIPLLQIITKIATHDIKVTIQQSAGTNRTFDYSFVRRKEA